MVGQHWLECVRNELSLQGLPKREISRLLAELSDHLVDVSESHPIVGKTAADGAAETVSDPFYFEKESTSMEASVIERLGSPAEIAETAVREFRRRRNLLSRSWLAAFCTFVLLPLPAVCLAWAASVTGLILVGSVLGSPEGADSALQQETTAAEVLIGYLLMMFLLLAPPAIVAVLYGRLARKTRHLWGWGLAACLLVAAGTALGNVQLTFSDLPGKSTMMLGLDIGTNTFHMKKLGQFLIPLAAGMLALRRSAMRAACVPQA